MGRPSVHRLWRTTLRRTTPWRTTLQTRCGGRWAGRDRRIALLAVAAGLAAAVLLPGVAGAASPTGVAGTDAAYANGPGAGTLAGAGYPGYNGDGRRAVDAQLDAPAGIAEDSKGDLFIADGGNCRVREVPTGTATSFGRHLHAGDIVTLAGGTCSGPNAHAAPSAVAV